MKTVENQNLRPIEVIYGFIVDQHVIYVGSQTDILKLKNCLWMPELIASNHKIEVGIVKYIRGGGLEYEKQNLCHLYNANLNLISSAQRIALKYEDIENAIKVSFKYVGDDSDKTDYLKKWY